MLQRTQKNIQWIYDEFYNQINLEFVDCFSQWNDVKKKNYGK